MTPVPSSVNPGDSSAALRIYEAATDDADRIASLINAAFVVERIAFDGDRIDLEGVHLLLSKGTFLIAEAAEAGTASLPSNAENLLGCVYVEPRGESCYLGLLSVAPKMQGRGVGRRLAVAAEDFARQAGCTTMDLRIISPRAQDLLPLYARLGFTESGTSPIPDESKPKIPCHYIAMTKFLANNKSLSS